MTYKKANSVETRFEVWKETYDKKLLGDVLFGDDCDIYDKIGIVPLRKKDLKPFSEINSMVNNFEEILRHNNVSDKENAFNRLTALFICKLYDEIKKTNDAEVEFQYKSGADTYESLQDRLQRLYRDGMKDFMKEDIFYVPDTYAEELIKGYTGQNRANLIEELKKTLRTLKFYTNNDFAFKEIHNEKLFLQNGKILVEVVELFERYRLSDASDVQNLGDLFERLLNKGFKQNEGQFFTPVPVAHFIWDSLPLKEIMKSKSGEVLFPRVVDYACGAGHFLTEGFEAINDAYKNLMKNSAPQKWEKEHLVGVEKDYRLARVSRIALYMHGAGEGTIIFGDGLETDEGENLALESFDILVANPPYSVKAFKNHLDIKRNKEKFLTLEKVSKDGSEIETLFVERIAQLVKSEGVAAVILPSSILNKENASFVAARESILKNFFIVSLVQLGSSTFGETGTNTIVLFLKKFPALPDKFSLCCDTANAILGNLDLSVWRDKEIFAAYLKMIDTSEDFYKSFVKEELNYTEFKTNAHFAPYYEEAKKVLDALESKTEKPNAEQKKFAKFTEKEKTEYIDKKFYTLAKDTEKEKLSYFALLFEAKTLIVTAPTKKEDEKKFLGYEWSKRKGNEGIQIIKAGGALYDAKDRSAKGTIASLVRAAFGKTEGGDVSCEVAKYCKVVETAKMLDFSRAGFTKVIKTSVASDGGKQQVGSGKWESVKIADICEIGRGKVMDKYYMEAHKGIYPVYSSQTSNDGIMGSIDTYMFDGEYVTWTTDGVYAGTCFYRNGKFNCTNVCGTLKVIDTNRILTHYLALALNTVTQNYVVRLANSKLMNNVMAQVKIPLPPLPVQERIVAECEAIDAEVKKARQVVDKGQKEIAALFSDVEGERVKLGDVCEAPMYGANEAAKEGNKEKDYRYIRITDINDLGDLNNDWVTANRIEEKYILTDGDILFARSGATAGKTFMYTSKYGKAIYAGYLIKFRPLATKLLAKYLFLYTHTSTYIKWAEATRGGTAQPNINAKQFSSLDIPLPPLSVQNDLVQKAQAIEAEISEARKIIDGASERKRAVLEREL